MGLIHITWNDHSTRNFSNSFCLFQTLKKAKLKPSRAFFSNLGSIASQVLSRLILQHLILSNAMELAQNTRTHLRILHSLSPLFWGLSVGSLRHYGPFPNRIPRVRRVYTERTHSSLFFTAYVVDGLTSNDKNVRHFWMSACWHCLGSASQELLVTLNMFCTFALSFVMFFRMVQTLTSATENMFRLRNDYT